MNFTNNEKKKATRTHTGKRSKADPQRQWRGKVLHQQRNPNQSLRACRDRHIMPEPLWERINDERRQTG